MTPESKASENREIIVVDQDITLKALTQEDADKLFELTDSNRQYLAEYLPWVDRTNEVSDSLNFIEKTVQERAEGESYGFGIFYQGELVGHTSLMHIGDTERPPEIGYWISDSASGKGLTTSCTKALTEFGFSTINLEEIIIRADVENIGSNKVAENAGYKNQGSTIAEDNKSVNIWLRKKSS